MDRGVYMALAEECGLSLQYVMPQSHGVDPDRLPDASHAVYIALDSRGKVCYVGTVCRPNDPAGLASHIREYINDNPKTVRWSRIYVLPLHAGTQEKEVRRIGGEVAGWLLPYDRERWPQAS